MILGINNDNIPVALAQGVLDGISTPDDVVAAIKVLNRPSELIPIPRTNHYFSNFIISEYKYRRISVSGGDASKLFARAAVRKIHRLSGGVPRLINLICHRALNNACSQQKKIVDAKLVRQTIREVRPVLVRLWFRKAVYWAPTLAAVFVVGTVAGHYLYPLKTESSIGTQWAS